MTINKTILIINTGGTISCIKTMHGYQPAQGFVKYILEQTPALTHADMPKYVIQEYNPLLDSSNIGLHAWNQIASDIATNYEYYDGFVILHGTDTMAYTASILSFMLEHINKPVIVTGSQIPLSEVRNDALSNVMTSLWLCAHKPITEVCIYFNEYLLRGNRAQKVSTQRFAAFESPNFPRLANIGINIELHQELLLKPCAKPFALQLIKPNLIANFRLFPGFNLDVLAFLLKEPIVGLVLETYGAGNAPTHDPKLFKLLYEATCQGMVIINCTQCQHGGVAMNQYATGHALLQAGLLSGFDLTLEAAHCKLLYLFSKDIPLAAIRSLMQQNLVGELSQYQHG